VPKAVIRQARKYLQLLEEASVARGIKMTVFRNPGPRRRTATDPVRDELGKSIPTSLRRARRSNCCIVSRSYEALRLPAFAVLACCAARCTRNTVEDRNDRRAVHRRQRRRPLGPQPRPDAEKYLGPQANVMVVNQPGASGAIGTAAVRSAPPDGYTLLLARIARR